MSQGIIYYKKERMKVLFLPAYFTPENMSSSSHDTNLQEDLAAEGVEMVVYTPIPETFAFLGACEGLVFHGSADPLCDTDMCEQLCDQMSLTYAIIPNANHSLETGNVEEDINNLGKVMSIVEKVLK